MPIEAAKIRKRMDKRPKTDNYPKPKSGIPPMPEWLMNFSLAVQNWKKEADLLADMKVMTHADGGALAMRSFIYSQLVGLALDVKEEGRTFNYQKMDSLGNEIMEPRHNPKVKQLEPLLKEYRTYGSLLGLDPSSRARLQIQPNAPKDPWDDV